MNEENLILVVDDDEDTRRLLEFALVREGYVVCCASTGKEALEYLKKSSPVLIILDMVMPDMDGYTFFEKIKGFPILRNIPVIISSGKAGMKEFFELEEGAPQPNAFLAKPYKIKDLVDTVKKVI